MALRNLVLEGDPLLRKTSRPVDEITPRIIKLLDDMADTMYFEGRGIGIAAPQVGVLRRVFVIDVGDDHGKIEDTSVKTFRNGLGISAEYVKYEIRVLLLECFDAPCKVFDKIALGTAYAYLSADDVVKLAELLSGLVHHSEDILGPFAQEHSLIVQYHILIRAYKQLMP